MKDSTTTAGARISPYLLVGAQLAVLALVVGVWMTSQQSCTLVYPGCTDNKDCPEGQICHQWQGSGECGFPATACDPGVEEKCSTSLGACGETKPDGTPALTDVCMDNRKLRGCAMGTARCCQAGSQECLEEGCDFLASSCQGEDCFSGQVECSAGCEPRLLDDSCNGVDDDCDGQTDEDVYGPCVNGGDCRANSFCELGKGVCRATGTYQCSSAGVFACSAVEGEPQAGVCDGLDNDCDGGIDEFELGGADPLELAMAPEATTWSLLRHKDWLLAAYENPAANVIIYSYVLEPEPGWQPIATVSGRSPQLVGWQNQNESKDGFFIVVIDEDDDQFGDPKGIRNELFLTQFDWNAETSTFAAQPVRCLSCGDKDGVSINGSVVQFEVGVRDFHVIYGECADPAADTGSNPCGDGKDNDSDKYVDDLDPGCIESGGLSEANCGYVVSYLTDGAETEFGGEILRIDPDKFFGLRLFASDLSLQEPTQPPGVASSVGILIGEDVNNRIARMESTLSNPGVGHFVLLRQLGSKDTCATDDSCLGDRRCVLGKCVDNQYTLQAVCVNVVHRLQVRTTEQLALATRLDSNAVFDVTTVGNDVLTVSAFANPDDPSMYTMQFDRYVLKASEGADRRTWYEPVCASCSEAAPCAQGDCVDGKCSVCSKTISMSAQLSELKLEALGSNSVAVIYVADNTVRSLVWNLTSNTFIDSSTSYEGYTHIQSSYQDKQLDWGAIDGFRFPRVGQVGCDLAASDD
ncbi:MAG: hypothetical protein RBU37_18765 [Myxococcota bacterium]|jgi:hypothetical protein|nr:hypothetical protein [Myxococcota bacterium]